jgi:hypothetical protein
MNQILVDGITYVAFVNGVLRIECGAINREGKLAPSGTLLIPAPQASAVLKSIVSAASDLERRVREKSAAASTETAAPPVAH